MNATNYTIVPSRELTELLDRALQKIGAEIDALRLPKLAQVVLGGGYGRGEGGVRHSLQGDRPYNDLDFFVFSDHADRQERRAIRDALKPISEKWERQLGIAVDFSPVKNLDSLYGVGATLMFQELRRGWKPVWGDAGFTRYIPEREAAKLPITEAVRLLLNRGMGLILAGGELQEGGDPDFIMRNLHKSVLGGGDALLIASGNYRWHGAERVEALREYAAENVLIPGFAECYAVAFRYKIEPDPRLPEDPMGLWRKCRELYLEAARRVAGYPAAASPNAVAAGLHKAAKNERCFKNFLRWTLRGGGIRPPYAIFDIPFVTVATLVYRLLATGPECPPCPKRLLRLWQKFN